MVALLLLACARPPDPTPWVGTWFGRLWWSDDDGAHIRTVLLDARATERREVPLRAEGLAWAARDSDAVACDGIVGGDPHERLVLVCDVERYARRVAIDLGGLIGEDHVEGFANSVPDDGSAPTISTDAYDDWRGVVDLGCSVSLDHAVDGVTERTLETSSFVRFADVDCTDDLAPWPTFEGEVDPSVTGVLLEFALGGEVAFVVGLGPDGDGALSWDGYPVGAISDGCDDVTTSLYAATGLQYQNMERIDL